MEAESFFARWSRRKAQTQQEPADATQAPASSAAPLPAAETPPPTLADAAQLTPASDFTPFLARGVDEAVKRSALKKLFSDPHFNVMDGLDVYIEDFNTYEPIPPAMLAALEHAKDVLNPPTGLDPLMQLLDTAPPAAQADAGNAANDANDTAGAAPPAAAAPAADDAAPATDSTPEPPSHDDPV